MAYNKNNPYNQGIGTLDLSEYGLIQPDTNMQTAGIWGKYMPEFMGGYSEEEMAQNVALQQIEGLRKQEQTINALGEGAQYLKQDELKSIQDQIQQLKNQYKGVDTIDQASLGLPANDKYALAISNYDQLFGPKTMTDSFGTTHTLGAVPKPNLYTGDLIAKTGKEFEDSDYEGNFRSSNHPDWWGKSDERANVLTNTNKVSDVAPFSNFYGDQEKIQGFDERGNPLPTSQTQSKWEKFTEGVGNVKDSLGQTFNTIKTKSAPAIGFLGALANTRNALNPNAANYNPALAGQIDFMKEQGAYGTDWDQSGLNKITGGRLAGKNLQSGFGSNDLMEMYGKDLARLEKTLANLPKQWSRLMKNNPEAYANKVKTFQDRIKQNKWEQEEARKDLETRNRIRLSPNLVQDRNYRSDPELSRIGREKYTGKGMAFEAKPSRTFTYTNPNTGKKQRGYSGGRRDGGRVGYANGGLASLFTRRG